MRSLNTDLVHTISLVAVAITFCGCKVADHQADSAQLGTRQRAGATDGKPAGTFGPWQSTLGARRLRSEDDPPRYDPHVASRDRNTAFHYEALSAVEGEPQGEGVAHLRSFQSDVRSIGPGNYVFSGRMAASGGYNWVQWEVESLDASGKVLDKASKKLPSPKQTYPATARGFELHFGAPPGTAALRITYTVEMHHKIWGEVEMIRMIRL